jgi:hypothetical protein
MIVWYTFARSGSNYLSDLVANIDDVESYREIFQNAGVHVYNDVTKNRANTAYLEAFRERFKIDFETFRDPRLVHIAHSQPKKLVNVAMRVAGRPHVSFKVFGDHLKYPRLSRQITRADNSCCIAFHRNLIDTYISAEKVKIANTAISKDTTDIKPVLDAEQFKIFLKRRHDWIDYINRERGYFSYVLSYDYLMSLPDDAHRIESIRNQLKRSGVHIADAPNALEAIIGTVKQDAERRPENKVSNYEQFVAECEQLGISFADDLDRIKIRPWRGN